MKARVDASYLDNTALSKAYYCSVKPHCRDNGTVTRSAPERNR
jgi:hypothetical protein